MSELKPKLLMIDNYDSFTYNLVQYLGELGAASAYHVDQMGGIEVGRACAGAHRARCPLQLRRRFTLQLERDQESRDQRLGRLLVENLPKRALRGDCIQRTTREHILEGGGQCFHVAIRRRKFSSRCLPSGVPTDSGWNCTPSTLRVLWRKPITSFSSVRALISRQSGTVSHSTSSE